MIMVQGFPQWEQIMYRATEMRQLKIMKAFPEEVIACPTFVDSLANDLEAWATATGWLCATLIAEDN